MSKSVAVIGQGFVGGSLTTVLAEKGLNVYVYDKAGKVAPGGRDIFKEPTPDQWAVLAGLEKPNLLNSVKQTRSVKNLVERCEEHSAFSKIYFVCLPTPMRQDGSADLTIVEGVLDELSSIPGNRIAVIKSTVPPGTTMKWNEKYAKTDLRVVFNPEFLREATALEDMRNQDRIVLGGPRPWINNVKSLYESAFPNVKIVKTSSTTAEMVKYVTNIHLAVKVSLANEFYQICSALDKSGLDIDYDKVVEYATYDQRLGNSHWKVPGPMPADDTGEPAAGWAGSCFVKDLNALVHVAKQLGIDPKVMMGAWEKNLEVRPQRDWEKLIGRAVSEEKK
jgi:UDPglucose 6-dehydrogenase